MVIPFAFACGDAESTENESRDGAYAEMLALRRRQFQASASLLSAAGVHLIIASPLAILTDAQLRRDAGRPTK